MTRNYEVTDTLVNGDDGIHANILTGTDGTFGVSYFDTDSGESLGATHNCATAEMAYAKARAFVNGAAPIGLSA